MNLKSLSICLSLLLLAASASFVQGQDEVDFATQIKPIFEKHCVSCHGPEKDESFRIDDRDDALAYVDVDSIDDSDLFQVLISDDEEILMPPPGEGEPLSDSQIQLVKAWVTQGADWPEDVKLVDTSVAAQAGGEAKVNETEDKPAVPAEVDPKTQRIFNAIGSLHPAAIHLPIGLLLASGLFALFSLRGNFVMSDCAYYCLWLGTLGAIVACATGWWFSPMEHRGTVVEFSDLFNQTHKVFWHRTGGLVVTAAAFLLALFAAGARSRDPDDGMLWKLGLIVLACGIGWVGHTGGELHYGEGHYKDLNGIYVDMISGGEEEADEPKAETKKAPAENDEVGEVSGENDI